VVQLGHYFGKKTGLHYNYFRDYDPQTGRYVQSDPLGARSHLSLFSYADSNPLRYVDPQGLKSKNPFFGPFFEQIIEFMTGKTAENLGAAESVGKGIGGKVCDSGGLPRGPLVDCSECVRVYPEHDSQEACFKGCRETIEKCTRPRSSINPFCAASDTIS
jgi:RHS repeat-associated protein